MLENRYVNLVKTSLEVIRNSRVPLHPKLATSLNPSDCAETEFDSSRYLKKFCRKILIFGLNCKRSLRIDPVRREKLYQWIAVEIRHSLHSERPYSDVHIW